MNRFAFLLLVFLCTFAHAQNPQTVTTTADQGISGVKTFGQDKLCIAGATSGTICFRTTAVAGTTPLNIGTGGTLGTAAFTATSAYAPATTGGSLLRGNGSGGFASYIGTSCVDQFPRSLSSTGAATCASVANNDLINPSISIAGTSTALGASITQDTITGLSTTGIVKRTGTNTLAIATAGTDYGTGNVSTVSVTTANGVSGSVANSTTTPAITLTLGAITPTTIVASSTISGSNFSGTSSGTNTGDQTITLTGDATGSGTGSFAVNVGKINGTSLAGLATGILKNTTTTGVPSIAVAGDFPTLNQNTTGSAATLTTPRAIYGNNFDGSVALTQIVASTYGGTGNGFTKFSGPTTSEKTFTLPNSNETLLYAGGPLATPASGVATNLTGTASGLTAGNVTTNANLTGPITSVGNATSVASQTGTGSTFAMAASPTFTGTTTLPIVNASGVLGMTGGATGSNPTPQINLGAYFNNSSATVSHIDLYGGTGQYGFGVSSNQLNIIAAGQSILLFSSTAAISGALTASSGITITSSNGLTAGVNATTLGKVKLYGSTSGDTTIQPPVVAGTATIVTLPNASSTLPVYTQQITYAGPTAARTVTYPDASFTIARTDAANTFTGTQTFSNGVSVSGVDITTAWTASTPTITAGAGTFTSVSGATRSKLIGKTACFNLIINVTTQGSASSYIAFPLPATAQAAGASFAGIETSTGVAVVATAYSTTNAYIKKYDGTFLGSNGTTFNISGCYETA